MGLALSPKEKYFWYDNPFICHWHMTGKGPGFTTSKPVQAPIVRLAKNKTPLAWGSIFGGTSGA